MLSGVRADSKRGAGKKKPNLPNQQYENASGCETKMSRNDNSDLVPVPPPMPAPAAVLPVPLVSRLEGLQRCSAACSWRWLIVSRLRELQGLQTLFLEVLDYTSYAWTEDTWNRVTNRYRLGLNERFDVRQLTRRLALVREEMPSWESIVTKTELCNTLLWSMYRAIDRQFKTGFEQRYPGWRGLR